MSHQAIIGADICAKGNAILNMPGRVLTLGMVDYPVFTGSSNEISEISVHDPITDVVNEFDDIFYKRGTTLKECKLRPLVIETGDSPPIHRRRTGCL